MGMFEWVDPTRNAFARVLRFAIPANADEAQAKKNAITDALLRYDDKYGKPFSKNLAPEQESAQMEMVQSFWNPAGMLGTTSKNSLAKVARALEKQSFETGAPAKAVGFHGSPSPDVAFDLSKPAFLSSHPEVANGYTAERGLWSSLPKDGSTVYPAKVEFKNPLVIDAMGKRHDNIPVPWQEWSPKVFGNLPKNALSVSDLAAFAKANGHDGLIVRNVVDTASIDGKTKSTVYAALVPDSFKGFFSSK